MRVLYIFTFMYSLEIWDKTGTLEKELKIFKELHKKHKVQFTFLTYGTSNDNKYKLDEYGVNVVPIFEFKNISKNNFANIIYSIYFVLKNKSDLNNCDVIKHNQLNGIWLGILLKYIFNIKLILRTGYDSYRFSVYEKKSKLKKIIYFYLTKIGIYFSDLYTVTSVSDEKFSKNYKIKNINLEIRRNWVENKNLNNFKQRNKYKILSVGRLEYQKNFETLIKDFENSNFEIDIVGSGSLENELVNLAKNLNVKINLLGQLKNEDLDAMYGNYMFYISSSIFEGNPKTVLEAMSNGCIPLLSNIENHQELVEDGKTGYLISNGESYIKKIQEIIDDKNQLIKIGQKAKTYVQKNNEIYKLIDEIYSDFLLLTK